MQASFEQLKETDEIGDKIAQSIVDFFANAENRKLCDAYIRPDVSGYGMMSFDAESIDDLVEKGYDSALGARPLRRVVQEFVEDPLADLVLAGKAKARLRGRLAKDGASIRF